MRFTKMHGLGNDYIFLNCMETIPDDLHGLARRLSDRHFGVGVDGIICICPSKQADFRMRIFNSDGSEGAMCGNGIRCFGKYVYERGLTDSAHLMIETQAGNRELELTVKGKNITKVTVDMGEPVISEPVDLLMMGERRTVIPVSMGNPHAVVEVENPQVLDLRTVGPAVECHSEFPNRVNAEFIRVIGPEALALRVWERGSGETLACGTGACAAVAAMASQGKLDREAVVHLTGGELRVRWEEKSGHVFMTGPAVAVFDGELAD